MYGNVAEFTESMAVTMSGAEGSFVPRPFDRFCFGAAWHAVARGESMRSPWYWGIGPLYFAEDIGIRCAKSAAP